ncbi:unnamed protein product [Blepharisma stoltei]|uniref:non-specific serine/threonine protein kinase n=1 Tax=Blepharisma stoltei TaxID=1481888 RepID=A0AAU9KCL9_9CILI|nr:unnamed protein product [Blepharisma stoltei]
MSIFASVDELFQNSQEFWKAYIPEDSPVLYTGTLLESTAPDKSEESLYSLTKKFLIKHNKDSKSPEFMVNIEWKLIGPFIAEVEKTTSYGFLIGHATNSKCFYTNSENELKVWLGHLSSAGIMTGIKDSFTFAKVIGKGAFSTVYEATCKNNKKSYAVKVIPKQKIAQDIQPLVREIKIMRKLKHPNIVKLYKVYESISNIYLVQDYVSGGDLYHRIIEKKRFSENSVKKFTQKMLHVLDYLKTNGVIHRDIKLENILLKSNDNDYDFKLIDFGLAAELADHSTTRCGSPGYIAPEMLRQEPYGIKVDIFSVGIIIYTLLAGKMPFQGLTPQRVLERNRDCHICFHDEALTQISPDGINLVQKLTCSYPGLRISPEKALMHHWFSKMPHKGERHELNSIRGENELSKELHASKSAEVMKMSSSRVENLGINDGKVRSLRIELKKWI